jgi:hypothetical protein
VLSPALVGRLRRSGLWTRAKRAHNLVSPPVCAIVHGIVQALGPSFVPIELTLKHRYDYEPIHVDPALIERTLNVGVWRSAAPEGRGRLIARWRRWFAEGGGWKNARRHISRNIHGRFVADGDWDLRAGPLRHRLVIRQLFIEGLAPQQTDEYAYLRQRIDAGNFAYTHGCLSIEDLDRYFDELVHAFDTIKKEGYRTQRELGNDGSDEIRICIDRNGEPIIFGGGTHRLSIAMILGIERVPVLVKRVHAAWVGEWLTRIGRPDRVSAVAAGIQALESRTASARRQD